MLGVLTDKDRWRVWKGPCRQQERENAPELCSPDGFGGGQSAQG